MNNHRTPPEFRSELRPDLSQKLDTLPERPGVYIYRSSDGKVIYVGKAVVLRNRVRSYFHEAARHEPRTRRLVTEIADLEWIVTDTELEALILENELIKRYRPRFNVRLATTRPIRISRSTGRRISRRSASSGAWSGTARAITARLPRPMRVRQTLDVLRRVFPYLDCNREITGNDPKPCLYYHIKRCAGPCIGAVDREGYRQIIAGLAAFWKATARQVLDQLERRMQRCRREPAVRAGGAAARPDPGGAGRSSSGRRWSAASRRTRTSSPLPRTSAPARRACRCSLSAAAS